MLGAGTILAPMRRNGASRPELDLSRRGSHPHLARGGFRAADRSGPSRQIAARIRIMGAGDEQSLAHIHLTQLRLPKLESEEQAFRIFLADGLMAAGYSPRDLCKALGFDLPVGLKKYSPDQPRDERGRWIGNDSGSPSSGDLQEGRSVSPAEKRARMTSSKNSKRSSKKIRRKGFGAWPTHRSSRTDACPFPGARPPQARHQRQNHPISSGGILGS